MRNRNSNIWLRGISILFISVAIVMTAVSLVEYSRERNNYPPGMTIAGVPVGGLAPAAASQRLLEVYTSPVEAHYADAVIQIDPGVVGFRADVDSMLAAADLVRTGGTFWGGYWDFLWNRDPVPATVHLLATIEEERLLAYLQNEIAPALRSAFHTRTAHPRRHVIHGGRTRPNTGYRARRDLDRRRHALARQPVCLTVVYARQR